MPGAGFSHAAGALAQGADALRSGVAVVQVGESEVEVDQVPLAVAQQRIEIRESRFGVAHLAGLHGCVDNLDSALEFAGSAAGGLVVNAVAKN